MFYEHIVSEFWGRPAECGLIPGNSLKIKQPFLSPMDLQTKAEAGTGSLSLCHTASAGRLARSKSQGGGLSGSRRRVLGGPVRCPLVSQVLTEMESQAEGGYLASRLRLGGGCSAPSWGALHTGVKSPRHLACGEMETCS